MIVPATEEHAKAIGELHHRYTRSLLRDLGPQMCRAFYSICLKSDDHFGCVYLGGSRVLGFIFGTKNNSKPFKNPKIRSWIALSLLKRPSKIPRLLFHTTTDFPEAPESLYSALDVELRGKGVGRQLYLAMHEAFKNRGIEYYDGRVDAENTPVLKIFERLDSEVVEEFVEDGINRVRIRTYTNR